MDILPILLLALMKQCPVQESILPCNCKISNLGSVVTCAHPYEKDLQTPLKHLRDHSLYKLIILGLNASTWQPDIFKGLHVKNLDLELIEVDDASFRPGRLHFQGLEESLETLEIKKSFKNGHRPLINLRLDHLSHLKIAIFEHNHIPEVGNDWFATGPKGLSTLIFEGNGIETLGSKAFSSLTELKLLAVAGNHLREIDRSMLPRSANKLHTLDLAYNKLRNLPVDLFYDMPSLADVNLDYNLIHVLKEDTFSSVLRQLSSLSLTGNPLECDEKMRWICKSRTDSIFGTCILSEISNGRSVRQFCENSNQILY
ncbi:relaxin receptor 1 [Nephila pilipes]|uniref:Relaxin receptor 1 n=1 Tax=Nephila pilipes TaxID=299642 RepID=A0A8X6UJ02_NEPPI|nr:relaxin receptor 1 [Nephila pilipes]